MNNLQITESINYIEKSLKQPIEDFFLSVYPRKHLVSHGIDHHHRVWAYAKELILNSAISGETNYNKFIFNIMIASYFHDSGMAKDPGTKHGELGRKLCTEFLISHNLIIPEFKDALEAIEYHDDKSYPGHHADNNVLDILSIADDLDAFGITGIFRYTEIYLKRGISFQDIGWMIIKNAELRFENLEKRSGLSREFKVRHKEKYDYLVGFFREYNAKLDSYNFCSTVPSGQCGIIQIMANNDINIYTNNFENYSNDPFIILFFEGLSSELVPV